MAEYFDPHTGSRLGGKDFSWTAAIYLELLKEDIDIHIINNYKDKKMASIKLDNISKWFDNNQVIKGVNLSINDGEFVVLVGPSGCGKSTLLRIISGLEDLNGGNIFINEEDVSEKIPSERDSQWSFNLMLLSSYERFRKYWLFT